MTNKGGLKKMATKRTLAFRNKRLQFWGHEERGLRESSTNRMYCRKKWAQENIK